MTAWYGEFQLEEGERACWRLGPLTLGVQHDCGEWRVQHLKDGDPYSEQAIVERGGSAEPLEAEVVRYIVAGSDGRLGIRPLLPDRAVVTRPVSPVFVPAGESVRLYVSVPLWLRIEVGEPAKTLLELPTWRLSDTWFGKPSALDGELCYALRSRCRSRVTEHPVLPYRAFVPVLIRNLATSVLGLERISVPVRQLCLFAAGDGTLWTQEVGLDRHEDEGEFAALRIGRGAPPEHSGAELIATSREQPARKTAIRAFSALFS